MKIVCDMGSTTAKDLAADCQEYGAFIRSVEAVRASCPTGSLMHICPFGGKECEAITAEDWSGWLKSHEVPDSEDDLK